MIRGRKFISCLLIAFSSLIFTCQAVFAEEIEVEISPSTVEISTLPNKFATTDQTISVSTTSPTGYIVNFSTAGATTSLVNQSNPSLTIPTFTLPSGSAVLPGNNTGYGYGYSTDNGAFYHPVPSPSSSDAIFTTVAPGSNVHTLTYGVYPSDNTAAGTYTNSFVITVVANTTGPCPTGNICYHGNGDDGTGTMENQQASSNSSATLIAPNFSRPGYGFVGWNTESDGSGTTYGPNETITTGDLSGLGMDLYAKWIPAVDIIQNWTGCEAMNVGDVTALRDMRDNEVYTVAKLGDGHCWMTENLRLNPSTATISKSNTNSPTDDFVLRAPSSSTTSTMCNSNNSSCTDNIIFNSNNTNRNLVANYNTNGSAFSWYSYGVDYNWYTATAGNGTYSTQGNSVQGDICPAGWHLPTGNKNGDFAILNRDINNNSSSKDANFRKYPNNFLWSGDYNTNATSGRGMQGRYWSATPDSETTAYRLGNSATTLTIANTYNKWAAFTVRCIVKADNTSLVGNVHYEANGGSGTMTDDDSVNFFITQAQANGFTPPGNRIFIEWNTSADGSGTSVLAGDLVGDAASALGLLPGDTLTLYAIWGEESTLVYDVNGGMGSISPVTNRSASGTFSFIVSAAVPTRLDYAFVGWSTSPTSQTADYHAGDTFTTTNTTNTLYAVWTVDACSANSVCYRANGAELGTSLTLPVGSSGAVNLRGSDYERAGYGFTGWNTEPDGSGTQYGPQQNITITDDLSSEGKPLYANWLASSGDMQTWSSCNELSIGDVVALTDNRDGNTYTIAKLQDGNCWMAENLRLDPSKVTFTTANTNSPTPDFIVAAPNSATSTSLCNQDTPGCVNQVAFDSNNINRKLSANPTSNDSKSSWYGYGVWYNWYTATAGNGVRETLTGSVSGDICPAGWRLPTGGPNSEFVALNSAINNGQTRSDANFKKYPNNFVYSGDHNATADGGRGTYNRYWSASALDIDKSYRFGMTSSSVTPANTWNKWDAFAVRCIKI
ncbi:InlB B-repeat-containing protein [Candidatus Saccharibacteria bacterium]|nr:InlB B-repeat-containing protein [Candidatus Saccharibacteria bacterium]